ncbi:hypothetical protein V8E53_012602 [Lactarius tabidus]
MADPSSTPADIVRITAPILFGPIFNWALYGVLCVQTYVYSYNFPDDRRAIKFLAYSVFLIETAQTALTGGDIYYWFIAGFGDLERLKNSRFSAIDSPTIDAFISLIVQWFFCYRIWTLNKRMWWLCMIIAILSVTQATGAAWGGIKSATLGRYAVIKPALYVCIPVQDEPSRGVTASASALVDYERRGGYSNCDCDDITDGDRVSQLRRTRGNEGRFSKYVLPRVVRLTVETNSLTASVAIVSFVLYVAFPNEIYYTCPTGVIGKLQVTSHALITALVHAHPNLRYSNTLFVTLNNRIYFRDHPSPNSPGDSAHVTPLAFGNRGEQRPGFAAQPRPSQSTTSSASIRLHTLLPPTDTEKGKSDFVTTCPVTP